MEPRLWFESLKDFHLTQGSSPGLLDYLYVKKFNGYPCSRERILKEFTDNSQKLEIPHWTKKKKKNSCALSLWFFNAEIRETIPEPFWSWLLITIRFVWHFKIRNRSRVGIIVVVLVFFTNWDWILSGNLFIRSKYSRNSMAGTPLGLWKLVRDRGSSSQWGLIIAPGQEAK